MWSLPHLKRPQTRLILVLLKSRVFASLFPKKVVEVENMKMQQLVNYTSILEKFAEFERPAELPRLKFSEIARAY